jgi:tetratricopeptide (TPR) repeat protein
MRRTGRTLTLLLALGITTLAWGGTVRGQVFLEDGRPAERVVVRLVSAEDVAYQAEQTTDSEGKFTFDGLYLIAFHLSIEGQGFQPYDEVVDIRGSHIASVRITMHPMRSSKKEKAVPPEGAGATIDARDQQVPAEARKELEAGQKLLTEKQDAEGGIKHLRKAIQIYSQYSQAYLLLGLTYLELGKLDDARVALDKANELNPAAPGGYFGLGTLYNQQKKYEDAEKILNHGLELKPDVADGQYQLARALWAQGRWQEAEPHARKAAELAPQVAPPHILLGNIALRNKDLTTARVEFSEYLRLDPKGPMAAGAAEMLKKLDEADKK